MKLWPNICPVCRDELPDRGNCRRYVSWKRGFRLVHAGACADAIDAQGVLNLDWKPEPPGVALVVRMRRLARKLDADRVQLVDGARKDHVAIARAAVAQASQPLVRENGEHRVERSREEFGELCRRLVQRLESCAPARTAEVPW